MRCRTGAVLLAAGLVVSSGPLAACGGDDGPAPAAAGPAVAGPPPDGLTIRAEYPRYLQHARRLAVVIENAGAEPVQITRVQLQAEHFELVPPEDKAHAVVTPGARLDLQADFGDLTSCDPGVELSAAVELDLVLAGAAGPTTRVVELDPAPLDEIRERECGRRDVDAALEVAFGDDLAVDDLDVVTTLELTRRPSDEPLEVAVESMRGSVLIDLDVEPAAVPGSDEPIGVLAADVATLTVPVRFHVFRCEPHAVAASTKTYEFQTWIALGGDEGDYYVVPLNDTLRSALEERLQACIQQESGGGAAADPTLDTAPVVSPEPLDRVSILYFGNSHTRGNDLPDLVADLVRQSGVTDVSYEVAPGYQFLDERLDDPASVSLLAEARWTHVVLQAQRYSSSGAYTYSTAEAEEWVRMVRDIGATPILFPEWPRRGIDETDRIVELHESIAEAEPACVPPIPRAFDDAIAAGLDAGLWASDGNHSSTTGALLAALVIAATITGEPVDALTEVADIDVDPSTQSELRSAAAAAVEATSPWAWCPADDPRS